MKGKLETGTTEPTDTLLNDGNRIWISDQLFNTKGDAYKSKIIRAGNAGYGNGPWFRCNK